MTKKNLVAAAMNTALLGGKPAPKRWWRKKEVKAMIYGIKWLVERYPRITVAVVAICWISSPLVADNSVRRWHYAINSKAIIVAPEIGMIVKYIHEAIRPPWFGIAYGVWLGIAVIAVEYLALRGHWRRT